MNLLRLILFKIKNYYTSKQFSFKGSLHKNIVVDFKCNIDENRRVAPLLFIILLENAFKHGVENLREDATVTINLTSSESNIKFTIENNFDSSENLKKKPGIGLKNLKRRLELTYPNKHSLLFSNTENTFNAQLTLN
ncbi:GHKL domain-containing protein [Leeuwenhoekiella palythoae]|uniref:GHKL domain-containing protein n=1 Tax=Leeuwenhoekiella palythoae TaxID=573501 RepID=UPI001CE16162|nr:GHKL domain-containing protein [Leeuwenhoekiella palythoae]UBZ11389.1 GHKL domain-containing protein [Leeuwenhoekiella palythoae]